MVMEVVMAGWIWSQKVMFFHKFSKKSNKKFADSEKMCNFAARNNKKTTNNDPIYSKFLVVALLKIRIIVRR